MKRGWCPSLSAPMQARDGWILRLKPFAGILDADQAVLVAELAERHGNGRIELTARGNVQLRGVREPDAVAAEARAGGLAPRDPGLDRLNLLVSPLAGLDERCAPDTLAMARVLAERAAPILPELPDKFGFAVDGGGCAPVTGDAVLRYARGAWRVEGEASSDPMGALLEHARMLAGNGQKRPRGASAALYGVVPGGFALGFAFGALDAAQWRRAVAGARKVRVTPWRALVRVGGDEPDLPDAITRRDDPRLRVAACVGQEGCAQGRADVRSMARVLAGDVPPGALLHVSGCEKGCAHPQPVAFVAVAGEGGYGLVRDGRACDARQGFAVDRSALQAWLSAVS